jgi:hypothetical protein
MKLTVGVVLSWGGKWWRNGMDKWKVGSMRDWGAGWVIAGYDAADPPGGAGAAAQFPAWIGAGVRLAVVDDLGATPRRRRWCGVAHRMGRGRCRSQLFWRQRGCCVCRALVAERTSAAGDAGGAIDRLHPATRTILEEGLRRSAVDVRLTMFHVQAQVRRQAGGGALLADTMHHCCRTALVAP